MVGEDDEVEAGGTSSLGHLTFRPNRIMRAPGMYGEGAGDHHGGRLERCDRAGDDARSGPGAHPTQAGRRVSDDQVNSEERRGGAEDPLVERSAGHPSSRLGRVRRRGASHVEILDVAGVFLDEGATRLDLIPHEKGEQTVGLDGVIHRHAEDGAPFGVHRRIP